ncbi:polysaccharide biosynthesis tyrosine autokinase [candidate division WOR-3 bacterium]|nr:polysaccharide biosynthesis tyrosine autokinase [candidate division WOR-3 bacterium]
MEITSETRATLHDYLAMLARRKWLALGVFVAMMGLTVLSIVRTKPLFQARATFMITPRREGGGLFGNPYYDPNAMNYIANCMELLRSRSLAEKVAQGVYDSTKRSQTLLALQAWVTARQRGQTDIIELVATGPSRASAVAAANAYLDAYQQYDLDRSRAEVSATRKFIEEQLAVAGPRLDTFERSLEEYKAAHRLTDLSSETQALIGQQAGVAAQLQQTDAEIRASEAQLAEVQSAIDKAGEGTADKLQGISSPVVTSLQGSLNQLEVDKTNLTIGGFDESSQRVRDLDRQIDSTRAQLRAALRTLIDQQQFVDPVGRLSGLFDQALTLNTSLTAARARRQFLATALARYNTLLSRVPEAERELAGLTRDAETGRRIHSLLSERYEEARIQEAGRVPAVRIIDRARGAGQTQPDVRRSVSFGLLLSLVLALGAVWGAEYLDTSIRSPRDLQHRGYSVLGSVPQLTGVGRRRRNGDITAHLITHTDVESSGAEAFRMMRTGLAFANAERNLRTIAVTSPGPSEGKSTVAVNLASVLAQAGSRVLLVDADMRNPVLHTIFRHDRKPGLSDLVVNGVAPDQAVFATTLGGLYCLPCGTIPPSPADLLTLNTTRSLLERMAKEYDYVVVDTPPVLVAADTPILGSLVDTNIVVVRAGRTALDALEAAYTAMLNGGAHLSGIVVNDLKRSGRYGGYYYYHHKYRKHYASHKPDPPSS